MSLTTRSIYGNPLLGTPVPAGYHCGDLVVDSAGVVPGFTVLVGPALAPVPVYVDPAALARLVPDGLSWQQSSTGAGSRTITLTITNASGPVLGRGVSIGFASLAPVLASNTVGSLVFAASPVEGAVNGIAPVDTIALVFEGAPGTTVNVFCTTLGPHSAFSAFSAVIP